MKYYLNAMPKSGLHLLDALCKPLTLNKTALWAGNMGDNSFTNQQTGPEVVTNALCYTQDNHRLIGHCCYDEDIEWYFTLSAIAHIFIYRDLRDVAVSQAHHVLSDRDDLNHPDKQFYRNMGGFDEVLKAVWYGAGKFPGVAERWLEYAPWLGRPGVLCLYFDNVIADLEAAADAILDYSIAIQPARARRDDKERVTGIHVVTTADEMVRSALDTDKSPTFRKGVSGEWRQYTGLIPEWAEMEL